MYTQHQRPEIPTGQESFIFQIIDIHQQDLAPNTTITMFGVTDAGNSISVKIQNFQHYFLLGTNNFKTEAEVTQFIKSNNQQNFMVVKLENHRSIYKNHHQFSNFFKISAPQSSLLAGLRNLFPKQQQFNTEIDDKTRFLVDANLVGCGWCKVNKFAISQQENCQINITAKFEDLQSLDQINNAQIRILSFDIECVSYQGFPKAEREEDQIIDIGCVSCIQGSQQSENIVFALKEVSQLKTGRIIWFETEREVLHAFFQYIKEFDPDLLTGYNIDNFDWPYVFKRAEINNVDVTFSRFSSFKAKATPKTFTSNQLGTRESYDINIPGRVSLDVLPQIQLGFKLRSYSLNSVSAEFLKMQKDDVHYSMITPLYNGTPQDRKTVAQYCLKDAQLPILLLNKLMIVFQVFEMSKVTGVTLSVLTKQGQQVRMVSLLARYCKQNKILIPMRIRSGSSTGFKEDGDEEDELEGATVLEPVRGYYDKNTPISTLDFSSLYPSIIIAHNLCYSTLVEANNFDITYFNKTTGLNMSFEELLNSRYVTKTPQNFYFLNQDIEEGLLPMILKQLLTARSSAKKDMKNAKDALELNVLNGRQLALKITANSLYGFTGALQNGKLPSIEISSSVTSFGRQMIEFTKNQVEQNYIKGTELTLDNDEKMVLSSSAQVIYGDTDSVMIKFGVKTLEESFKLAIHAAKFVTLKFKAPISLEFEKVYCPYLLINKKRYAGLYWTNLEKYDKIDVKGLELVRRDNCQLVPITMKRVLEFLFFENSPQGAVKFVKSVVQDLLTDRIDVQLLVISKSYSQAMKDYKNTSQPHLSVVTKMMQRGHTVKIGDRIQYVITRTNDKELYKRSEDPSYTVKNGLQIDTDYYLHQQLEKPISRLLGPVLAPKLSIDEAEKEASRVLFSGLHTLFTTKSTAAGIKGLGIKVTQKCIICNNPSQQGQMCQNCVSDIPKIQQKYDLIVNQLRVTEFRANCIGMECFQCQQGIKDIEDNCANNNCEIYFARMKQKMELERLKKLLEQLEDCM
ncbi:DNA polymerase [Spironucleus salmonicida]|uniref:DNA polymerase n=1 Tax=Spironucleus salmonicida TaxID=348837 RepID=V6LQH5_9EUKA|nr:DNA polymerase [Spironucleus salmonicida]|eukprot:EST43009.1 DNA polymerase delta, catalytic subunit [Spironucleus salmonicida]